MLVENPYGSKPQGSLGDDLLHHLVSAAADADEARVAEVSGDASFGHIAHATVELQARVGDKGGDTADEQLGHRDLGHWVLVTVPALGDAVHEVLRDGDLRVEVDELVPVHLELADRASERLAFLAPLERFLERNLCAGDGTRGADQALALQLPHQVVETLPNLAEHGVITDLDVIERQLRGVARVHAELFQLSRDGEAGKVLVDEEQRDAVRAVLLRTGSRDQQDEVAAHAVRDVELAAVDPPVP